MINKIINLLKTTVFNQFNKNQLDYNIWIFSSSDNKYFNYNSKYLFEYVLNNESDIKPRFVINDDSLRTELQNEYGKEYFIETISNEGIKYVLSSGVWFTSAGLPTYGINLSKKRLIINLWHGVPLKKIALLENNISNFTKLYFKHIFSKNYTHILTTSKQLIPIMSESFGVEEDIIKVWGQPRNDSVFKLNDRKQILETMYHNLPSFEKIILYAPTYREFTGTEIFPFEDFTKENLNKFLEENDLIIFIRTHQSESNLVSDYGDRVKLINDDIIGDIMDIVNIFDLLITDYSSIYIDYLLTKKPIIFLPYDKDEYLSKRGLNFEYDEVTPGPKPTNYVDFEKELLALLYDKDYYSTERESQNQFFNEVNYESSSEITSNIKDLIKRKIYKN